jgi:hypothetical protein
MIFFLACVTLSTWILAMLTYLHVVKIWSILEHVRTNAKRNADGEGQL